MLGKIALLILGVTVTVTTRWVTTQADTPAAFLLFYGLGVGLIIKAIYDLATTYITDGEETTETPETTQKAEETIIACPKCQTRHYASSNYCHKCGEKL
jgi:uncharacterized paraquat-inducible protein A